MFIHPTQRRTLTPREAARVQTFPDWFGFPRAQTHAFRLIGNAVPPLVAESVGSAVKHFLNHVFQGKCVQIVAGNDVASHAKVRSLSKTLGALAKIHERSLRQLSDADILAGWHALLELFPELHPVNALDHGKETVLWKESEMILPGFPASMRRRFLRSGWPIPLSPIAREVWRRFNKGRLAPEALYNKGRISSRTTRALGNVARP